MGDYPRFYPILNVFLTIKRTSVDEGSPISNPYENMDANRFWRSAIAERNFLQIADLWHPKNVFDKSAKIVTAGSCFAQHIGNALQASGFNWFDAEPAPVNTYPNDPIPNILSAEDAKRHGYGVFSFRTGNIYTTSLFLQWVNWAIGLVEAPDEVWETDGRFYDPFRPVVEPNGFGSAEEVRASRRGTIEAVERAIRECSVFVFTLGLTEKWVNTQTGVEYPMCPGTAAGTFDPEVHKFENMDYVEVTEALEEAMEKIRGLNPDCKFLLTVSPVPLTATASDKHVLVATTYSKSVLRAVAGAQAQKHGFVDYFPSYEIINSAPFRGAFFMPNQRSVAPEGVAHVMSKFFEGFSPKQEQKTPQVHRIRQNNRVKQTPDDISCEEELLDVMRSKLAVRA